MRVWVDCRKSMNDADQMRAALMDALIDFERGARATVILADRETIIALANSTPFWEKKKHYKPGWQFRTFCGVDLASTDLVVTGVFTIEGERRVAPVAQWGVPAPGGKARPPRVAMYHPKDADKGKQDEPVEPRELAPSTDDETDNQRRDDILRKIFS